MKTRPLYRCALVTAISAQSALPAMAQDNAADNHTIEHIIVEARFWKENPSTIPASATLIQDTHLNPNADINLISQNSANVTLEDSSVQTRASIRGVTGLDGGLQEPIGYFINGVALPLGGNQLPALAIFDTVEVLKGPQGTLYGRNTEAGAIKLKSLQPDWQESAYLSLSQASLDSGEGSAEATSISLGGTSTLIEDKLAGSVSLLWRDSQGPYINKLDNNRQGGELTAVSLSAGLLYQISEDSNVQYSAVLEDADQGRNRFRYDSGMARTERFVTNANTAGFDDDKIGVHALTVRHRFDKLELVSITGLSRYQRTFEIDLDASPAPLPGTQLNLDNDSLSQELRLSTITDAPLKWVAGLYVYRENSDIEFSISPRFITSQRTTNIDQSGQALFGQVEYALNPQWKAALGGRYERTEQSGSQHYQNKFLTQQYHRDINENEFLSKASLSFAPNTQQLLYLSYSEGYLPGGYNYNSAGDQASFTFDAEYSELIELGWKTSAQQGRLNGQIALFELTSEDKQIVDLLPGFVQSISNAGKTRSYGAELEIDYQISPTLSAYVNLGLQHSEAVNFTSTALGVQSDLSGNKLRYAPEHTYSAGIKYKPINNGFFAQIDARGSSEYFLNSQNTIKQSGLNIINAEFGYRFGNTTISLWAKNITDQEVISRAVTTPLGVVVEDTQPRITGIKVAVQL